MTTLNPKELIVLARKSIEHGFSHGAPLNPDLQNFPELWRQNAATFVTLHLNGELRGCIGTLKAREPLVTDICHNAYQAAFEDPRFPPLSRDELPSLDISISILGKTESLSVTSEADLLDKLRPGKDGIVLSDGRRSATFLPAVWEQLPDKHDFIRQLKRKAGWPDDYWSNAIKVERYGVEEITATHST